MQDPNQVQWNHYRQISAHDRSLSRDEARILATVPSGVEKYPANGPSPEIYRQALKVMLADPETEKRLNYITAGMIVSVFGGYLAGKAVRSREFAFLADVLLFLLFTTLAGLVVGVMVGVSVLPIETLPILLFIIAGMLVVGAAVVLAKLIFRDTPVYSQRSHELYQDPNQTVDIVTMDGQTYYRREVNGR